MPYRFTLRFKYHFTFHKRSRVYCPPSVAPVYAFGVVRPRSPCCKKKLTTTPLYPGGVITIESSTSPMIIKRALTEYLPRGCIPPPVYPLGASQAYAHHTLSNFSHLHVLSTNRTVIVAVVADQSESIPVKRAEGTVPHCKK